METVEGEILGLCKNFCVQTKHLEVTLCLGENTVLITRCAW